jgi:hypothetical protein
MIVDDFDVESVSGAPSEANAPLIVDADRVLLRAIAFQLLKPVARNPTKFIKPDGGMDRNELLQRAALHVAWYPPAGPTEEKLRRLPRGKASDHDRM